MIPKRLSEIRGQRKAYTIPVVPVYEGPAWKVLIQYNQGGK